MKIFTIILLFGFSTVLAKAQTVILNSDFSAGLPAGWSLSNPGTVGWQFGTSADAVETYNSTTYFAPAPLGNIAFDLDLNNNDTYGQAALDRLITPALDLTSYSGDSIFMAFDAFFVNDDLHGSFENFTCEVSTNNGTTWTTLQNIYGVGIWHHVTINVSACAGQSNVKFCFHYSDGGTWEVGAAVGNVQVFVPAFIPQHRVVFEEATGLWCSYCVSGIVYQDSLEKEYPDNAITISVHDNLFLYYGNRLDPMTIHLYDSCEIAFPGFIAYPSNVINRLEYDYVTNAFAEYSSHINDFGEAAVTVNPSYNSSTRQATINVNTDFARNLIGKYNLALVLTEDSVHNDSTDYNQNNAYSGGGSGVMGNFQNLPDPVPGSQMYYMYVARSILGDTTFNCYTGTKGSLPDTVIANAPYSYQFSYTVPAAYNAAKMKAIALLLDASTGDILNANSSALITAGINQLSADYNTVNLFPDPAGNTINVSLNLNKSENVVITLTDILGRTISKSDKGNLSSGNHQFSYDISALPEGIYFLSINSGTELVTKKFIKAN